MISITLNFNLIYIFRTFQILCILFVLFSLFFHIIPNSYIKGFVFFIQEILTLRLIQIRNGILLEMYKFISFNSIAIKSNLIIFNQLYLIKVKLALLLTGVFITLLINFLFLLLQLIYQ
ncbi:MAG: hypothetical protein DRO88_06890 [Promethearchaeia archaeon]|nr:MAG: hypothetical protein DRO88_06890 [Candidatus Lokiarchaeia archaeon]